MTDAAGGAWVNGRVLTGTRSVEALLVEAGQVVVAGSDEQVRRARGTGTPVADLGGRVVIPGLIDAHVHVGRTLLMRHGLDLSDVRSRGELLERVAQANAGRTGLTPLLGGGWDETPWPDRRYPTREELDTAAGDLPVVLYRHCEHIAVVNSATLDQIGVDASSPDPPRGRLGRANGDLDGTLAEGALGLLRPIEESAMLAHRTALPDLLRETARFGLTSLAPVLVGSAELDLLHGAAVAPDCPVRFRVYVRPEALPAARDRPKCPGEGGLRVAGVKLVADGSFGARTAWLEEPYHDAPGETGFSLLGERAFTEAIAAAAAEDLPVAVHAIGDRALHQVLTILRSDPGAGTPRVEHASLTPPPLITELLRLRPDLVVQPRFVPSDTMLPERLGPERCRWTYAFRTLSDHGLLLAGSSDAPVESLDPWTGIAAAVAPRTGPSRGEELLVSEALDLYTLNAGRVLGDPGLGTLEPGAPGDLVILDANSWEAAVGMGRAAVRSTYRAGRPTYERPRAT